jgi:UDP-2,3-diacylglucosamine pyrophosphatase LpxH
VIYILVLDIFYIRPLSTSSETFLKIVNCELILNGDMIDSPYKKLNSFHQKTLEHIEQISYKQKVIWIKGNHDNGYIPRHFGEVSVKHLYAIDHRLLVSHGDYFDEIMPRSQVFMKVFMLMHNLRVKLGARPVHMAQYAKKWEFLYRVLRKNVMINAVQYARKNGYEAVTCGHTHFAEDIVVDGIRYINTGAWTEYPIFYLQITGDEMGLKRIDNSVI